MSEEITLDISPGVSLSLNGRNISTDGSGRVNVNDIAFGLDSSALICQSNVTTGNGQWYLHPTEESTEEQDRIKDTSQGWFSTTSMTSVNQLVRQVRLRRATGHTAQEGVFTCYISKDSDTPISVGIYYPSELRTDMALCRDFSRKNVGGNSGLPKIEGGCLGNIIHSPSQEGAKPLSGEVNCPLHPPKNPCFVQRCMLDLNSKSLSSAHTQTKRGIRMHVAYQLHFYIIAVCV